MNIKRMSQWGHTGVAFLERRIKDDGTLDPFPVRYRGFLAFDKKNDTQAMKLYTRDWAKNGRLPADA